MTPFPCVLVRMSSSTSSSDGERSRSSPLLLCSRRSTRPNYYSKRAVSSGRVVPIASPMAFARGGTFRLSRFMKRRLSSPVRAMTANRRTRCHVRDTKRMVLRNGKRMPSSHRIIPLGSIVIGHEDFCCRGYCIDLMQELSKNLSFVYTLHLVADNKYGSFEKVSCSLCAQRTHTVLLGRSIITSAGMA